MSGTILIVDDLATNRIVLKVRLATTPYRVVQAGSAREGLRMAMAEPPDLVLASARLDGQSAAPFLRALRRDERLAHVPILLLQSTDSAAERLALLRAGADAVLTRPVPEPLLLARLRNLLRAATRFLGKFPCRIRRTGAGLLWNLAPCAQVSHELGLVLDEQRIHIRAQRLVAEGLEHSPGNIGLVHALEQ